jgi:adenylate cyclase
MFLDSSSLTLQPFNAATMERRLTAILAADVVGYSRLMGADEAGTLAALRAVQTELIDGKIAQHQGRIVKLTGDGILAEFPSVVNALACATEVQRGVRERNTDVPQNRRIAFRVGVNVASRLESIADPGGITVSRAVRDHVGNRFDLAFEDRGEQQLKNIEKPVHVYSVILEDADDGNTTSMKQERPSIAVLPFHQHGRRSRAGVFQRWHHRRHHYRSLQDLGTLGYRASHFVHLQSKSGKGPKRG